MLLFSNPNIIKNRVYLFVLVILLNTKYVDAKLYKWVDKDGKAQFSDHSPTQVENVKVLDERTNTFHEVNMDVDSNQLTQSQEMIEPIVYSGSQHSKKVEIENVLVETQTYTSSAKLAGKVNEGKYCDKQHYDITWKNLQEWVGERKPNIIKAIHHRISEIGYQTPFDDQKLFTNEKQATSDISLIATITEADIKLCAGSRDNKHIKDILQDTGKVTVVWRVFDNLHRKEIYQETITGVSDRYTKNLLKRPDMGTNIDFTTIISNALMHSVNLLFAKPNFTLLLIPSARTYQDQNDGIAKMPLSLQLKYGDSTGSFSDQVKLLNRTTVTIRSKSGHGSGFILTEDGYIITNEHVVEHGMKAIVIIDEKEYEANVIRINGWRDVALLKLVSSEPTRAAIIAKVRPAIGEIVYAVGTPLDEAFSHTVTQGIISSYRTVSNQEYLQTDAAINKGNSGGAVFNNKGEVVAITVSGIFAEGGGSLNINFLIPIDGVLKALNIESI